MTPKSDSVIIWRTELSIKTKSPASSTGKKSHEFIVVRIEGIGCRRDCFLETDELMLQSRFCGMTYSKRKNSCNDK